MLYQNIKKIIAVYILNLDSSKCEIKLVDKIKKILFFLFFSKKCINYNKSFSYKLCYIVTLAFLTF